MLIWTMPMLTLCAHEGESQILFFSSVSMHAYFGLLVSCSLIYRELKGKTLLVAGKVH